MPDFFRKYADRLGCLAIILIIGVAILSPQTARAAACPAPAADYGLVTSSISVPATGSYRIWSRIAVPDTTNNSYMLEVDGSNCYTVGGASSLAVSAGLSQNPPTGTINWTWVDYQNGVTSSKININLTAGSHNLKLIGSKPNVAVDRIIATQDTTCVPTGTGENCANPADTTKPTVSITAPSNGATVSGTVNITATASDDSGTISKVEFYIDNSPSPAATDLNAPYTYAWNTSSLAGGSSHTITARAYDASNNFETSSIAVTIQSNLIAGDSNNDGKVNILDLLSVINNWGEVNQTRANGELDGTSPVNIGDLLQVLNNWNP